MKNICILLGLTVFFVISILAITLISPSTTTSVYANSGGSPGARTNSPGDGNNCTGCHGGALNPGAAIPAITAPGLLMGYVPGQIYTVTVGITGTTSSKNWF